MKKKNLSTPILQKLCIEGELYNKHCTPSSTFKFYRPKKGITVFRCVMNHLHVFVSYDEVCYLFNFESQERSETLYVKSEFCHQYFNLLPAKKRIEISMGASNRGKKSEKSKEEM